MVPVRAGLEVEETRFLPEYICVQTRQSVS
jgi:hypothetical protein